MTLNVLWWTRKRCIENLAKWAPHPPMYAELYRENYLLMTTNYTLCFGTSFINTMMKSPDS